MPSHSDDLSVVWDEFFRVADENGTRPPGRGKNVHGCRYVKALGQLVHHCSAAQVDPVDFIRAAYPIALNGRAPYVTPKQLLEPWVMRQYRTLQQKRGDRSSVESVWLQSIEYLRQMQRIAGKPLDLDAVLECATQPLSATFRLGCRATPPPELLLRMYGETAALELRQDRLLMALVRKECPWLLTLLAQRFGLDTREPGERQRPPVDDSPQPTITIR